jgi:hypothetical protein
MGVNVTLYLPVDAGQEIKPDSPYWENEYHEFYSKNITHNLTEMAEKAKLYEVIWRPYKLFNVTDEDEDGVEIHAKDLVDDLLHGLTLLKSEPEEYKKYNPSNGWGSYDSLVSFAEEYLKACMKYPEALINVSR